MCAIREFLGFNGVGTATSFQFEPVCYEISSIDELGLVGQVLDGRRTDTTGFQDSKQAALTGVVVEHLIRIGIVSHDSIFPFIIIGRCLIGIYVPLGAAIT